MEKIELPPKILEEVKKAGGSKKLLDEATEIFKKHLYSPEEAIGVIAAQSLSEPATQMTMRTYHFAGGAGIQVTLGLPRIIEIFDARKEPQTPTMTVFLEKGCQDVDKARKVAENIKELKLRDVVVSDVIDLTNLEVICKLDIPALKKMDVDPAGIPELVKLKKVKVEYAKGEIRASSTELDVKNLHQLKYKLLETHIKGIKGMSQAIINKDNGEWVISTLGSSLKKVMKIEGVDKMRTTSNNIFEIQDVFGIEAARNAIVMQSWFTLDEQGLDVDIRYIMLLADLMTFTGEIKPIGRYGIVGEKNSILARAAFEETKKHVVSASIKGEKDNMIGVIENIMTNQLVPVGTGSYDLVGHIPLEAAKSESKPRKEAEEKKPKAEPKEKKPNAEESPRKKVASKKAGK